VPDELEALYKSASLRRSHFHVVLFSDGPKMLTVSCDTQVRSGTTSTRSFLAQLNP